MDTSDFRIKIYLFFTQLRPVFSLASRLLTPLAARGVGVVTKRQCSTRESMKITQSVSPAARLAQGAFNMIEILMGTAILSVMVVSLYGGMSSGFAVTQLARENLRGTQIMLERMEGIRLYNWNQLVYSNMIPTSFTSYYYPMASTDKGVPYTGSLTLTKPSFSPAVSYTDDMRVVNVSIYWTNTYGTHQVVRSRSMQTYVGRMGMQNYIFGND